MATLLYRLGRFSARRAWLVITAWIVVFALAVVGYVIGHGALTTSVSIPGTATTKVADELAAKFPQASGGSGTIVFQTADGSAFTAAQQAAIGGVLQSTAKLSGVRSTTDPFETQAELAKQTQQIEAGRAQLDAGRKQLDQAQQQLNAAKARAQRAGMLARAQAQFNAQQQTIDGNRAKLDQQSTKLEYSATLAQMASEIRMVSKDDSTALASVLFETGTFDTPKSVKDAIINHVSGTKIDGVTVHFSNAIAQSMPDVGGIGEVAGLVVAAITLLIMLGTFIGAGMPLLNALVGVGIGVAGSMALSGTIDMLSVTPILGLMLGLAVGIDYSLFILNRHRMQLRDGVELHESIGLANGTSGNAVVFAGSTVLIALLALNVTGIPFLGLMGTVAAICVAIAILIAITLTPAILSLVGMRIHAKRIRARLGHLPPIRVPMKAMGTGRAIASLVIGVGILVVIALPGLSMRLGLPDGSSEPVASTQYKAFKAIEQKFGAGVNGPLLVVADLPQKTTGDALLTEEARIGKQIFAQNDVSAVAPIGASTDNTMIAYQVIPKSGPTSKATEQLVRDLRGLSPLDGGVRLGIAGNASGNIDISEKLAHVLPIYLALVVGLSLVIMIFVFRSFLVPLTATLGFIMSVFAAFGGITAIFQWGWLAPVFRVHDPGAILSFLPILQVGILFGLAMDYQLFLVSGMREAFAHGVPARLAVQRGAHAGRTVVTAAAIIMISVFAGFIFNSSAMIQSIGFGLAFGVLLDAFLVRMLLIPAAMHLLGRAAWWLPRWLDRIMPNIDVEGAQLERSHPHPSHVYDEEAAATASTEAPTAVGAGAR